ncbi:MAG: hypothetical protein RLZZ592_2827 [Pseudomonadota bacterium]|jgi:hypothetical protein
MAPDNEREKSLMDLKLPIVIVDELADTLVKSTGILDFASGEITEVRYQGYDVERNGFPARDADYDFTSGTLSNGTKEVEFGIRADAMAARYSVTPDELLELKGRAAKLFAAAPAAAAAVAPVAKKTPARRKPVA